MLAPAAFSPWRTQHDIVDGRRGQLVTAVQAARRVVAGFEAKAAAGTMTADAAQAAARDTLRAMHCGNANTDYFCVCTLDGGDVMHPIRHDMEVGSAIGKAKDGASRDVMKAMVDALAGKADGTAFVGSNFPRSGQTALSPKLQFVTTLKSWNWMLGSGLPTDDVDAQVREAVWHTLVVLSFVGVGGIGWFVARSVLDQLGGDPMRAIDAMREAAGGNLAVELGSSNSPAP